METTGTNTGTHKNNTSTTHVTNTHNNPFLYLALLLSTVSLPVLTHILSVMLHCWGGVSVVVVKGEMNTVVAHLGGLVLGTGSVRVLLFVWLLLVVVVIGFLVVVVCRAVVDRAVKGLVTSRDGAVVSGPLLVVVNWTEAVVVSRRGVKDSTWDVLSVAPAKTTDREGDRLVSFSFGKEIVVVAVVNSPAPDAVRTTKLSVTSCGPSGWNVGDEKGNGEGTLLTETDNVLYGCRVGLLVDKDKPDDASGDFE